MTGFNQNLPELDLLTWEANHGMYLGGGEFMYTWSIHVLEYFELGVKGIKRSNRRRRGLRERVRRPPSPPLTPFPICPPEQCCSLNPLSCL